MKNQKQINKDAIEDILHHWEILFKVIEHENTSFSLSMADAIECLNRAIENGKEHIQ